MEIVEKNMQKNDLVTGDTELFIAKQCRNKERIQQFRVLDSKERQTH